MKPAKKESVIKRYTEACVSPHTIYASHQIPLAGDQEKGKYMKLCRYSNFAEGRGDPRSKHMMRGTVLFPIQYDQKKKIVDRLIVDSSSHIHLFLLLINNSMGRRFGISKLTKKSENKAAGKRDFLNSDFTRSCQDESAHKIKGDKMSRHLISLSSWHGHSSTDYLAEFSMWDGL